MSEHVPTTALMREWHVRGDHAGDKSRSEYEAEFDRWLEQHDREVAERAWDKAVESIRYEDGSPVEIISVTNPYRLEAGDSRE